MFTQELTYIQNDTLREMVGRYMEDAVPAYFYKVGASSSGKFHPAFSQGEGGLVRHTKAAVMILKSLMDLSSYAYMPDEYKDYAYAALIIHDTCKYGMDDEIDKKAYKEHERNAASLFENFCLEHGYVVHPFLLNAVKAHMGQWAAYKEDKPFTNIDRVVHLADYIASRNFIDIPELSSGM